MTGHQVSSGSRLHSRFKNRLDIKQRYSQKHSQVTPRTLGTRVLGLVRIMLVWLGMMQGSKVSIIPFQKSYPQDVDVGLEELDMNTFKVMWEMSAPGGIAEGCFLRLHQTEYYTTYVTKHYLEMMPEVSHLSET